MEPCPDTPPPNPAGRVIARWDRFALVAAAASALAVPMAVTGAAIFDPSPPSTITAAYWALFGSICASTAGAVHAAFRRRRGGLTSFAGLGVAFVVFQYLLAGLRMP